MGDHYQQNMLLATLAGAAVGAPFLAMMGFSFLATLTLFLVTWPLLLIFSPLLLCAGFVLAGVLAGFVVAVALAITGLHALSLVYREVVKYVRLGSERVKDQERDGFARLQQENCPLQHPARLIQVE